ESKTVFASYKGFNVYQYAGAFYGIPESVGVVDTTKPEWHSDDRIISGASFSEIRCELDNWEANLMESVSNLNICVVGDRYAVVPHAFGPIDFRIRKQRDDDRIHWTNSLAEARDKANMLASARHERPSPVEGNRAASIDDSSGTSHSDSI